MGRRALFEVFLICILGIPNTAVVGIVLDVGTCSRKQLISWSVVLSSCQSSQDIPNGIGFWELIIFGQWRRLPDTKSQSQFWGNSHTAASSASIQSLSHVRLFVTPWTAARQASLSITISQYLLTLTSIESVIPSNHLILCRPLLLLPLIFPTISVFSSESVLCIMWSKYWSFSFLQLKSIFKKYNAGTPRHESKSTPKRIPPTAVTSHHFLTFLPSQNSLKVFLGLAEITESCLKRGHPWVFLGSLETPLRCLLRSESLGERVFC